ncbi:hypothetical protein [Ideonella sp. YS5]|uniref:hypothetical protein n=1 Tax=Ideonella sp. YS5 TaxID=3453714 RepID=UPI003EEFD060
MRRLALVFLLLWLPLHWSWAATVTLCGHAPATSGHPAHAAVLDSSVETEASDPASEQGEECSLCQAADWQAALPTMPRFVGSAELPAPFDEAPPFKSYVPPVPKPPARLPAA